MTSDRFHQLQKLFERASDADPAERNQIVSDLHVEDPELGDELAALLAVEQKDGGSDRTLDVVLAAHPEHAFALERLRVDLGQVKPLRDEETLRSALLARAAAERGTGETSAAVDAGSRARERVFETVRDRTRPFDRYETGTEIARGGMGAILRVRDRDLRRQLAMKVQLVGGVEAGGSLASRSRLARFLDEAQITGQLDHPGIVPVHELGADDLGRAYFTMKLVEGKDLRAVFRLAADERDGWTRTRVVRVLHRVCEAMAYAHEKGILHRDLKPANVMVGRFGEVYVMDWGVARFASGPEVTDVRPRVERADLAGAVDGTDGRSFEPLLTMDGEVVGTPAYMSPEQAFGGKGDVTQATDIYAVGAMLYHVLVGRAPFSKPGESSNPWATLARLARGAPDALRGVAPQAPAELVSICEKAMARSPRDRYATMLDLAGDLEAYLEGRVVGAYEAGAWAEAKKWVLRNRGLAASLLAVIVATVAGLGGVTWVQAKGKQRAEGERRIAVRERNNVLRLSAFQRLEALELEAEGLWPATEERLGDLDDWLERASALVAGLEPAPEVDDIGHRAQLAALHAKSVADPTVESGVRYPDAESRWWAERLEELIVAIEAFADPQTGIMASGVSPDAGSWGVARRRDYAATVADQTVAGADARTRWAEAIASIRDEQDSPAYGGLVVEPQLGLLPIGPDPESGLWEFLHVMSGSEPTRGEDGRFVIEEESGVVLVLIPGGTFWMGAQADDPAAPNYDSEATSRTGPVHEVTLSPFFLSKYELSQAQWARMTGRYPSRHDADVTTIVESHVSPVEFVKWARAVEVLEWMQLELPSEAQWEYAARAGTRTTWWTGSERDSLLGAANFADVSARERGATWSQLDAWPELDDGYGYQAPPGTYRPNPFGLHEMLGNVREWCVDGVDPEFYANSPRVDPVCPADGAARVYRGGCYQSSYLNSTSATRFTSPKERADLGIRPARALVSSN